MNYKQEIYDGYVTTHTEHLYGKNSLKKIINHFPSWNYYYGEFLPNQREAKILDIGCGDGGFVYWLNSIGYEQAIGIDISSEQIEAGRSLGIQNIRQANLNDFISRELDTYDLIVARDVIEHFNKPEIYNIIELILKSLKPGGKFLMQVPNGEGLFFGSIFYSDFTHEVAFTGKSIRQVLLNTGFEAITVKPVGPPKISWVSSIRWLLWQLLTLVFRGLKMIETGRPDGNFTQNIIGVGHKAKT